MAFITYEVRVHDSGTIEWVHDGKPHREDGPACEYASGDKFWYIKGELHREDGPACEYTNGEKNWYSHGKLHREDGPAIELANGAKRWYLGGTQLDVYTWEVAVSKLHSDSCDGKTITFEGKEYQLTEVK